MHEIADSKSAVGARPLASMTISLRGPGWFAGLGTERSGGTKAFALTAVATSPMRLISTSIAAEIGTMVVSEEIEALEARGVEVIDRSAEYAMLALQGPNAREVLARHLEGEAPARMRVAEARVAGVERIVVASSSVFRPGANGSHSSWPK